MKVYDLSKHVKAYSIGIRCMAKTVALANEPYTTPSINSKLT